MDIRRRWAAGVGLLVLLPALAFAGAAAAAGTAQGSENGKSGAVLAPAQAGQALRVSGAFGSDLAERVRAWLDHHPDARVLVVDSPGGMRWQALRLAELVNARGITVRVEGRCASACALLWAAADLREMNAGARLGLHRSRLRTALPLPPPLRTLIVAYNDRKTARVLRAAGFPEHLIEQRSRTAPTRMSWYAADQLLLEGVPFTLRDGSRRDRLRSETEAAAVVQDQPGPAAHAGS